MSEAQPHSPVETGRRLYPERPGINIKEYLDVFREPPEVRLAPEERNEILSSERQLTKSTDLNHDIAPMTDGKVEGIEIVHGMRVNSNALFLDYFVSPQGHESMVKAGFKREEAEKILTKEDAKKFFLSADYSDFKGTVIGDLERESATYIERRTVEAFEKSNFSSVENIPDPEKITIVRNPAGLVRKAEALQALKTYLKKYDASLSGEGNVVRGKKLMVKIHRRRVNELIAELYPDAQSFMLQAEASGRKEDVEVAARIGKAMSAIKAISDVRSQRNFARLDKFKSGAGELDKKEYSQVSSEAIALAEKVEKSRAQKPTDYKYKGWEDAWKKVSVTSVEQREWAEKVLEKMGDKSESAEYDPDREGSAPDGKWQAVARSSATSLSVNGKQKVLVFPPTGERNIAQIGPPAGALPVLIHELTHKIQHDNKSKVGLAITEVVGMDRSALLAEGGGVFVETNAQRDLFGQVRTVNTDYLRAAQARLNGGSYRDCVKAFYDSMVSRNPNTDKKKAAEQAANRAQRLFRSGGQTSDKSKYFTRSGEGTLEYLEQELMAQELRDTPLENLFYLTGVNIEMLSELHKMGLFDLGSVKKPDIDVAEILHEDVMKKFQESKSKTV